jgi:hypothetical protein
MTSDSVTVACIGLRMNKFAFESTCELCSVLFCSVLLRVRLGEGCHFDGKRLAQDCDQNTRFSIPPLLRFTIGGLPLSATPCPGIANFGCLLPFLCDGGLCALLLPALGGLRHRGLPGASVECLGMAPLIFS